MGPNSGCFMCFLYLVFDFSFTVSCALCLCGGQNLLVRPSGQGTGQFELFLLDHGLYRDIGDDVRRAYCRLWRGLVLRRRGEVEKACEDLGAPGLANVFSIFLLNRSLNSSHDLGVDLRSKMSKEELRALMRELREGGIESGGDIAGILENVPRNLLLIFKMNSLVRNINAALGAQVDRFRSNARNAVRGLHYYSTLPSPNSDGNAGYALQLRAGTSVEPEAPWIGTQAWGWLQATIFEPVALWSDLIVVEFNLLVLDGLQMVHRWWYGSPHQIREVLG